MIDISRIANRLTLRALVGGCWLSQMAVGMALAAPIPAARDTTIFQNNPNNSAGGQTQFYSGTNTAISPRRGLVSFDIASNVPAGATITSVDLTLTLSAVAGSGMGSGSGSPTIELHDLTKDWGEGTVSAGSGQGAAAGSGDATWNSSMNGSASWTNPGGDFSPTASATLSIVGTTLDVSYTWLSTPQLKADVQGWLDHPATNFGWLLLNTSESVAQTFRAFYSREATTAGFRPMLVVNYTVPEPSTFALLAFGSTLALARCLRRRDKTVA